MSFFWKINFTVVNNSDSEMQYETSSPGVGHHDDPPTIPSGSSKTFRASISGADAGEHYVQYSHSGESVRLYFQAIRNSASPITANDPENDQRITSSSSSGPGVYDRSVEYHVGSGDSK
ncbi:hypothetical protein TWF481_010449 [Arthrobotrys musiformis]|uniref:Uncharacterized protein n=1 Tax=Arthrobotrys musiformis TaxID=47236 RepID=A0AAV9W0X1_9PEZI